VHIKAAGFSQRALVLSPLEGAQDGEYSAGVANTIVAALRFTVVGFRANCLEHYLVANGLLTGKIAQPKRLAGGNTKKYTAAQLVNGQRWQDL
ncbi:MAG: hypothetical protein WBN08_08415, partial [Thiogranum sp.]